MKHNLEKVPPQYIAVQWDGSTTSTQEITDWCSLHNINVDLMTLQNKEEIDTDILYLSYPRYYGRPNMTLLNMDWLIKDENDTFSVYTDQDKKRLFREKIDG